MRIGKNIVGRSRIIQPFLRRILSSGADGVGELGRGAGRGGGAGGSIREAGGSLGKMGAAREEEYFYKKQNEQLLALKNKFRDENRCSEEEIKKLQSAIENNKKALEELEKCFKGRT